MRDQTAHLPLTKFTEFRKRLFAPPLLLPAVSFAAGIWVGSALEINLVLIWAAVLLSVLGILVSLGRPSSGWFWILIAFFLAGILRISAFETYTARHVKFLTDAKGSLQGRVASFPETVTKGKKRMTRFLLSAESWRIHGKTHPAEGEVQVFIFYAPETIRYGDRIRVWGELKPPKRATNPEEFDYASYLEKQRIFKVFQAFGAKSIRILNGPGIGWRERIERLRLAIQGRILRLFPNPEREIIQALWLGFRRNIPEEINHVFIRTGTIHLLSISGLHVTLVGGFFYFLFRFFGIPRKLNALISILVILFYSVMAGGMPPVLRAACMGVLILGSILLEQDSDSWYVLIAAFLLLVINDPGSLFLLSFQLSFMSMAVLILFSKQAERDLPESGRIFFEISWKEKVKKWFAETIRTSCLIVILLLPVFALYFHSSSLSGILANTLAIPVSLWVMVGSLIAILASFVSWPVAFGIAALTCRLFSMLFFLLTHISKIPYMNWPLASPSLAACLIYYGAIAIFYWHPYFRKIKSVLIAGALILFLGVFSYGKPVGATFFDAGHSDSILIRLSGSRHLLLTAGRRLSESRLNWVIEPSVLSTGTRKLWILYDDKKHKLNSGTMKNLEYRFPLEDFDAEIFPEAELFWQKNGKLAALRIRSNQLSVLMLLRSSESLIRQLRKSDLTALHAIYVAEAGKSESVGDLAIFLEDLKPKHIIFNDRKFFANFLDRLNRLGRSELHFLSERGAVSL